MTKLLIDCDPGVDDAMAILFALNRRDAEVIGISVARGNCSAAQGTENALRLLKLAGREGEIPVCMGAAEPLYGLREDRYPTSFHGENGLGNIKIPASSQKAADEEVEDFLYRLALENEGEIVLIELGRMTNIARTIQKYPSFVKKIRRVVCMGGTVFAPGNSSPVAEANFYGDPEAIDLVMQQDWPLTVVGLDVTTAIHLYYDDLLKLAERCREDCREEVKFLCDINVCYQEGNRRQNRMFGYFPLHDPLALIVALEPSVVNTRRMPARVECEGKLTRGMIVTDRRDHPIEGKNVEFCLEVNERKVLDILFDAFM